MLTKKEDNTTQVQLERGKLIGSEIKRGYLNANEANNLVMIHTVQQLISGIRSIDGKSGGIPQWESWAKSGIITKEQTKTLKTINTLMIKFINSVFENNLDVKTKDAIVKKVKKWEVKVVDDYTFQKIQNLMSGADHMNVPMDTVYELVAGSMQAKCRNCRGDRNNCDLHTAFIDLFVPPSDCNWSDTCEYAHPFDYTMIDGSTIKLKKGEKIKRIGRGRKK